MTRDEIRREYDKWCAKWYAARLANGGSYLFPSSIEVWEEAWLTARAAAPQAPAAQEPVAIPELLSEQWLRDKRDEVRRSPEAEKTVWWLLLARAIEKEIGEGYMRLYTVYQDDKDELMRTWHILKMFGAHPGRTDDRLSDCVRAALAAKEQHD